MGASGVFLGLIAMGFIGDAVVSWIRPRIAENAAGRLGLALLIGPTVVAFACFALNLAGVRFGPGMSWAVTAVGVALWLRALQKRRTPSSAAGPAARARVGIRAGLWGLLAGPVLVGAALAWTIPPVKDSLVNWSLKTHVLWTDETMFTSDFHAEHRYLFHTNYPPLVPIGQVYLYGLTGEPRDRQAKLLFTLFHLGAALVLLGFLARRMSGVVPLALAALAAAVPHLSLIHI